jgi:inner membrane protein
MMFLTHTAFTIAVTSLALGTASPLVLATAAIACQFPDIDTSKSKIGRLLKPISRWIEKRFPHRTLTHSFLATGIVALLTLPIAFWGLEYWQALTLGYFLGWFGDVFTKKGVAAFYPSAARLVIPGNPRLRLTTGSRAELFVLAVLVGVAIVSININSYGGILRSFNQALGIPTGAVEIANAEVSQYLLTATVKGLFSVTQQPVDAVFEVVRPLTQSDLLVKDSRGRLLRTGTTQECQIIASQILIQRRGRISSSVREVQLQDQLVAEALTGSYPERTYINGTLTLEDAEDLLLPTHADQFDPITLQPGQEFTIARLESASPAEVVSKLGDYYATGSLIIRSVEVLSTN